jgi:hypothetical protein
MVPLLRALSSTLPPPAFVLVQAASAVVPPNATAPAAAVRRRKSRLLHDRCFMVVPFRIEPSGPSSVTDVASRT